MENSLLSEVDLPELQSSVNLVRVFSEVDDDYRTLDFRLLEDGDYRQDETDELRILE